MIGRGSPVIHGHMYIPVTKQKGEEIKKCMMLNMRKKECGGNSIWFDDVGVKGAVTSTFSLQMGCNSIIA